MILPTIALIVAVVSLFFVLKDSREIKRTIESDKGFIEWREKRKRSDNQ